MPLSHRLSSAAVAIFLATVLLTACTGVSANDASSSSTATTGVTGTTAPPVANARWTALAPSPLINQTGFLDIWTGTELLVCCGAPSRVPDPGSAAAPSAAAFNPTTNSWRPIHAPPTNVQSWGSVSVIDNVVYFLDGGTAPWSYEVYDIGTDSWRDLPPPPVNAGRDPNSHLGTAAWDGHEIFTVLSTPPTSDHDLAVLAVDPATGTWRTLPPPPVRMEPTAFTADGTELTLLGQQRSPADQHVDLLSATFDTATNSWQPPRPTGISRRDPVAVGGDDHVVVWDVTGSVRVQDGDQWHAEPQIPFPEDECGWKGAQLDRQLVLWRCTEEGAVLDTDTGVWSVLPPPPTDLLGSNIVALGDQVVLWATGTDTMQPYRLDLS
jgi:hypothetical protein